VADWKLEPARDLGLRPEGRAQSVRRESGLISTISHTLRWALVRNYLRTYHRLKIINRGYLPKNPPFIVIGNHASHLDAIVLGALLPGRLQDRAFPLAAGDVFFDSPAKSVFSAVVINAFPMWRGKAGAHALMEMRKRLTNEPCVYILFPEGKRSRDGNMNPFKSGIGMLVAGTEVPVVPCYLDGTFQALPANCRWPRPRKIVVHIGEPLLFPSTANEGAGWREISQACENAVRALADRPGEEKSQPIREEPD
jgi:1-acyl-sn-glycerol-3-phosphate acyltransferase